MAETLFGFLVSSTFMLIYFNFRILERKIKATAEDSSLRVLPKCAEKKSLKYLIGCHEATILSYDAGSDISTPEYHNMV